MSERQLADRFERQRPELRAVAYRILGSLSEADDAVQDAWLRLQRTDAQQLDSLEAWLTTVAARICLNMLRSRRTRGEQPLDGWRPEPLIDDPAVGTDPEHEALLADSVGIAVQAVLETLSPAERLAFVLHDMFAVPFDEIAAMLQRSPQATRQLGDVGRPEHRYVRHGDRAARGLRSGPESDLRARWRPGRRLRAFVLLLGRRGAVGRDAPAHRTGCDPVVSERGDRARRLHREH